MATKPLNNPPIPRSLTIWVTILVAEILMGTFAFPALGIRKPINMIVTTVIKNLLDLASNAATLPASWSCILSNSMGAVTNTWTTPVRAAAAVWRNADNLLQITENCNLNFFQTKWGYLCLSFKLNLKKSLKANLTAFSGVTKSIKTPDPRYMPRKPSAL